MKNISPWAATVPDDLKTSTPLFEKRLLNYAFTVHNTGDSVWIVANCPKGGRIEFRAAFGLNSVFDEIQVTDEAGTVRLSLTTRLAKYKILIAFSENEEPILQFTTTIKLDAPTIIPFWPRDIVSLVREGDVANTFGQIHVSQEGARSGQVFFSMTKPKNGSIYYIQNLGSLSDYCEATKLSVANSVGGSWPEIGFQLPVSSENPLPADKEFIISDATILLSENIPENEFDVAAQFIESLAKAYLVMRRPDTEYRDWPEISKKVLNDLITNKGCWTYAGQHSYLNAYLCDYATPPEIMVQLAVMRAIYEYAQWAGKKLPVVDEIRQGLAAFYDEKLKTISRWLPSLRDDLDGAEEQKEPLTMDSWYLHHPLMNLSNLALDGDKKSEDLLLKSIDYVIKVAHHFKYEWPVFYKMDTLEILKEETAPGKGGEKDVAGGYTHLMMNMFMLTKDKKYLNEAKKAAKSLKGLGLDIFYQANNTAFSALALLRLYKETREEEYLRLSNLCIAGILKNVQLWESDYGYTKHFPTFFAVFPLNDAPYKAAYEEMEVYAALNDYYKEAQEIDAPILPGLKILLPEFVRYSVNRLPYYYPPMLPKEVLSDEVKTGELDPDLWIPIEDLYDGWEKNGQVGQEVYGAGVGFGVAPRQYQRIKGETFQVYCDYPMANFKVSKYKSAVFDVLGDNRMTTRLQIVSERKLKTSDFILSTGAGKDENNLEPIKSTANVIEFELAGGQQLKLKWK